MRLWSETSGLLPERPISTSHAADSVVWVVLCFHLPQLGSIGSKVCVPEVPLVGIAVKVVVVLKTAAVRADLGLQLLNPGHSIWGPAVDLQH